MPRKADQPVIKVRYGRRVVDLTELHGCVTSAKRLVKDPATGKLSVQPDVSEGESAPPPR